MLARTLTAADFANVLSRSVPVAVARTALRMAVVAFVALVAVRRQEFRSALALAASFGAIARREEHVALARCTYNCLFTCYVTTFARLGWAS